MNPLNNVVSNVERVDILRKNFDLEHSWKTGLTKRAFPPARAFDQCGSYWFWGSTINVVDQRFPRGKSMSRRKSNVEG